MKKYPCRSSSWTKESGYLEAKYDPLAWIEYIKLTVAQSITVIARSLFYAACFSEIFYSGLPMVHQRSFLRRLVRSSCFS